MVRSPLCSMHVSRTCEAISIGKNLEQSLCRGVGTAGKFLSWLASKTLLSF